MQSKKSKTACFTRRGLAKGNIWKAYSAKTDKIIILYSDRQLSHWLVNLEFNHLVVDFKLGLIEKEIATSQGSERVLLNSEAFYRARAPEWQIVRSSSNLLANLQKSSWASQLAQMQNCTYREYSDLDLLPYKSKILPLLRVASILSFGRKFDIPDDLIAIAERHLYQNRAGTLRDYLSATSGFDQAISIYFYFRKFSEGKITVEFDGSIFDKRAKWRVCDEKDFM